MRTTPDPRAASARPTPDAARLRELLQRYDRAGPRYTSYPTALELDEGVGASQGRQQIERAAGRIQDPWSLYVHLPFCQTRCLYCACTVVITKDRAVAGRYLDALHAELGMLDAVVGGRRRVSQLHLGGGTPTWYGAEELDELLRRIRRVFDLEPGGERAVEVDPRVTTREQLETLASHGFARLSLGVQDLDPDVQAAVGRIQPLELTARTIDLARSLGYSSINVDLIYGLPRQSPTRFQRTLDDVVRLRPERVAVYSFAHLPTIKAHQRRIRTEELPTPAVKLELLARSIETFTRAGYRHLGMDHFAVPEDELALAEQDGTLGRNFMGYTRCAAPDMLGLGMSAIGDVGGALLQNQRRLIDYEREVAGGRLPIERGILRSPDDELRRAVIAELMVHGRIERRQIEARFRVDFAETFAPELGQLAALEDDGLVICSDDRIQATATGRLLVRNIAMVFDAYRQDAGAERFSRTV